MVRRVIASVLLVIAANLSIPYAEPPFEILCFVALASVVMAMLVVWVDPVRRGPAGRVTRNALALLTGTVTLAWLFSLVAFIRLAYARHGAIGLTEGSFILFSGPTFANGPQTSALGLDLNGCVLAKWGSQSIKWSARLVSEARYVPIIFLLASLWIATLVAWRYVPRPFPPGHCQKCGYNLAGNISGTCPECGTRTITQEVGPARSAQIDRPIDKASPASRTDEHG